MSTLMGVVTPVSAPRVPGLFPPAGGPRHSPGRSGGGRLRAADRRADGVRTSDDRAAAEAYADLPRLVDGSRRTGRVVVTLEVLRVVQQSLGEQVRRTHLPHR